MLVLSRHENEAIVIGGRIKVTVVEIRGHQIRLGIEAPKDVTVWREEVRHGLGPQEGIGRGLKSRGFSGEIDRPSSRL